MKRIVTAAVIIFSFLTASSFAQQGLVQMGSSKSKGANEEFYDPQAAETVIGEVISMEQVVRGNEKSWVVRMTVRSDFDGGIATVYFCPKWSFERHGMKVEPNTRVQIKGSRVVLKGSPAIIAAEVRVFLSN